MIFVQCPGVPFGKLVKSGHSGVRINVQKIRTGTDRVNVGRRVSASIFFVCDNLDDFRDFVHLLIDYYLYYIYFGLNLRYCSPLNCQPSRI